MFTVRYLRRGKEPPVPYCMGTCSQEMTQGTGEGALEGGEGAGLEEERDEGARKWAPNVRVCMLLPIPGRRGSE